MNMEVVAVHNQKKPKAGVMQS
eukprot:SAG25_NODE_12601_length_277_cov_1.443820_1_plen_21_part_01